MGVWAGMGWSPACAFSGERARPQPRDLQAAPVPRAPRVAEEVFSLEAYGILGELRYNEKGFLRATCRYHVLGGQCRRQRQTTAGRNIFNPAGRPVGALILWLKNQKNHDTQVKHVGTTIGSYNDRKAAREWFKTLPGAQAFLDLERPRESGEAEEPRDIR